MEAEASHLKQLAPKVLDTGVTVRSHPQTKADLRGSGLEKKNTKEDGPDETKETEAMRSTPTTGYHYRIKNPH